MNRRKLPMSACALASIAFLAGAPALAQQQGQDDADTAPGANAAPPAAPGAAALPGVVLERNVFVPVDASGKPTSNQFIVVERRALTKGDGEGGASSDGATPGADVPTRFILVPQQAGDDSSDEPGGAQQ